MKNMKKIIFIVIASLSLLVSTVYATWIIMKNVGLTPSYDPNAVNVFMEEFDGQSVDYNGGMQTPKSSKFTTGDVIFKHRKAYSNDSYTSGGPFDAGTYEILIQSNNEAIDYVDTVVLFTVNPIDPTITSEPSAKLPTIEGEYPSLNNGVATGVTADGNLKGTWDFDMSDLVFGKQTTSTITKNIACTFTPESPNYNTKSVNINVDIMGVALIGTNNYYGTVEQAIKEAANGNNVFVIAGIKDATGHYPTIKQQEITIPSGITLTLTYRNDDYTTGYKIYSNGEAYSSLSHLSTYGSQLCIAENVTLTLNGTITVGAYVGSSSTVDGKEFAVLMNNGTINSEGGSVINSYGYIKGTGWLNVKSNATVNDIFRIYDFAGGRYAPGMFYKKMKLTSSMKVDSKNTTYNNIMPFNCYSIHNVSCNSRIYTGATYKGRSQLNISNSLYVNEIVLIGNGGLFDITSEYLERTIQNININDESGYSSFDNSSFTESNQKLSQVEVYDFYGNVIDNAISIALYIDVKLTAVDLTINTNTDVAMPISTMHFNFKSGSTGTFDSSSYKFLPGTKVTVENGATIDFAEDVNVVAYSDYYDNYDLIAENGSISSPCSYSYYKNRNNLYVKDSTSVIDKYKPYFEIYGTAKFNGGYGGVIKKAANSNVTLSKNSATIDWLTSVNYLTNSMAVSLGASFLPSFLGGGAVDLGGTVSPKTTNAIIENV